MSQRMMSDWSEAYREMMEQRNRAVDAFNEKDAELSGRIAQAWDALSRKLKDIDERVGIHCADGGEEP